MTQLVWSQCSERKRGGRELELRKWESLNQKGETTSGFSPFEERERERERERIHRVGESRVLIWVCVMLY